LQDPIFIVGAGQAGVQIAESLRQEGFSGPLSLIGEEVHPPYHRPPLSKKWLAQPGTHTSLSIRGAEALVRRNIDLKLATRVVAIERVNHQLVLGDGTRLRYQKLALTTGSRPHNLPPPGCELTGVYTLRSIDDALHIGAAVKRCAEQRRTVAIIGGGFIGLEVAATARKLGAEVVVFEGLSRLMARIAAPIVSSAFERVHAAHGVELVFEAKVSGLQGADGAVKAVFTAEGKEYPVGCVVVGIGVSPDDVLAAASGLACERGVIVDDCARTSDPDVVAAGDCTARRTRAGALLRLESVQNAVEQGKSAAAALMGRARPFVAAPWFWSDQYDIKLQLVGLSHGYDEVVTRGDVEKPAFSAFYFRAGRLIAVDSLNRFQDHMSGRKLLDQGLSPTPAQVADQSFDLQSLLKN